MAKEVSNRRQAIEDVLAIARANGDLLEVSDIRYITIGIPIEITDDYIVFGTEAWEIDGTGTLGGPPSGAEKIHRRKMILMHAICTVGVIPHPK